MQQAVSSARVNNIDRRNKYEFTMDPEVGEQELSEL